MKSNLNDLALFLLRLALGGVMWAHGAQKLLGLFGGEGTREFVHQAAHLGFPAALAWLVIAIEFLGGIALVLGVLSRLAALGYAGVMAAGIWKLYAANGFFMNWHGVAHRGEGCEYPLVLGVVALVLLVAGPGKYALYGRTRNLLA
jgi:putative oxidoreductase